MNTINFRPIERPSPVKNIPSNGKRQRIISDPGLLSNYRPEKMRLLACLPPECHPNMPNYVRYLGGLLNAQLSWLDMQDNDDLNRLSRASKKSDLVVFGEPHLSFLQRAIGSRPANKVLANSMRSVLFTQEPLWPIRHILLILRIEPSDETAVSWVCKLAQASGADVTILPIVPSLPAMYAQSACAQVRLDMLLSSNTPSGQQVRRLMQQFNRCGITGTLRLRQGEPDSQIRWEVAEENYDLIVMGEEPHRRWQRWLLGELVSPLLQWNYLPTLIAKSMLTDSK